MRILILTIEAVQNVAMGRLHCAGRSTAERFMSLESICNIRSQP